MRRNAYVVAHAIFLVFALDVAIKIVRNENVVVPLTLAAVVGGAALLVRPLPGEAAPLESRNPCDPAEWRAGSPDVDRLVNPTESE